MAISPNPVQATPEVLSLLDRLHDESIRQEKALGPAYLQLPKDEFNKLMQDKFIALDKDKCHFMYQIARAINARTIIEVGTSFGVSTIYLSLAVGANTGGRGKVIGTEFEPSKASKARETWKEAGREVSSQIELRQGDLRETLNKDLPQSVDMVLLDIWSALALPALKLVEPSLRKGAVILVDNTIGSAKGYAELLAYLRAPESGYTSLTLPYDKGFEMCVKVS